MKRTTGLAEELLERLVSFVYPELMEWRLSISYRSSSSFADVTWEEKRMQAVIHCDQATTAWPDVAVTGLLAHELSHPAVKCFFEEQTDLDVIHRGLGVYLAVERVYCGKYEDHLISRGKDKYLGYRSIRELLMPNELYQLDRVLKKLNIITSVRMRLERPVHDFVVYTDSDQKKLIVDGQIFTISKYIADPEIDLRMIEGALYVFINGRNYGIINKN